MFDKILAKWWKFWISFSDVFRNACANCQEWALILRSWSKFSVHGSLVSSLAINISLIYWRRCSNYFAVLLLSPLVHYFDKWPLTNLEILCTCRFGWIKRYSVSIQGILQKSFIPFSNKLNPFLKELFCQGNIYRGYICILISIISVLHVNLHWRRAMLFSLFCKL